LSKHLYVEQEQEQTEQDNRLLQRQRKPQFVYTETGPTSCTLKGQFVKPGVIDHRYRTSATALHSQGLSQTGTVGTPTVASSVSPRASGHVSLIAEAVQARVKSNASWDGTGPTCYTSMRSPLVALTRQYLILLGVLLAEYRSTWFFHVLNGLLLPISFTFFIVAVGGVTNSEKAIYLLGGNMALSIAMGPTAFLITKLGWARQSQEFDYWIALPISKMIMMFALLSVALLFALPGLAGTYVVASLLFGLPFNVSAWILIPLVPLAVLPLAGVGAMLGTIAPSGQIANILSNIVFLFVGILSPLMLPVDALPIPLRITSQFVPTTYVADAFRTVLRGHIGSNLVFDIIILVLFSAVLLTLTYFRLDWRNT
jgi:ABC-2 type transport system permease protein